jgi:uncharacterized protein (TIGR02145 family)
MDKQMADGKRWTTRNLDVKLLHSYCYEDKELNCIRYGRMYTWESAREACQKLGSGWRLPTDEEWRNLSKRYGGVHRIGFEGDHTTGRANLLRKVITSDPAVFGG